MRREIKEYYQKHPPGKMSAWTAKIVRAFRVKTFRWQMAGLNCGSPRWHKIQERLSRKSSVGLHLELRTIFYETTLISCGNKPIVHPMTHISYPQNLRLSDNVFMNRGVIITAPALVSIGSNVLIGPYCVINSGNHIYADPQRLVREQGHKEAPITIEDDVWIGAQVCILAGVTIGKGAVIGANAVVNKSVPANTVVAGVPAKPIKSRA